MEDKHMRYYETPREEIDYFREEYEFLSNFYPAKIVFEGITYFNAEAAFQAQKCLRPEERIHFAHLPPNTAKQLGKKVERRADWDDVQCSIMEKILYEKFVQNPALAQALLDTGNKTLKKGSYRGDLYWGVNLKTGEGENRLGKILMQLREYFRTNGIPAVSSPHESLKGPYDGIWIDDRDITLSECECIVNAANETLLGGGGVDGAIHRAAGPELRAECATLGGCNVGEAKLTGGYRLKATYIIHTVGPKYPTEHCEENLTSCYIESLNLARKNEIHSIVFPLISTGKFGYPKEEACHIAVQAARDWLKENGDYRMKIVFSCVDPIIYELIYSELNNFETA